MVAEMTFQEPPLLQQILLEEPWAAIGVLAILGLVLLILARHQQKRRRFWCGVAALALALCVWAVSEAVTTDRERLLRQTRLLLKATSPLDLLGVRSLLEPDAVLLGPDRTPWFDHDGLLARLDSAVRHYQVLEHVNVEIDARTHKHGLGRTEVKLRTRIDSPHMEVPTRWTIRWRLRSDGRWRIMEMQFWEYMLGQKPTRGLL